MIRWGVDLGGTKIEGVVLKDDKVICRHRLNTEGEKGYHHVLNQIYKLIDWLMVDTELQPDKIGFGTPGSIDPITGHLKNSNSVNLNGKELKGDLEKLLSTEIALANDANCFALAETQMGIVQDVMPEAKVVFGVIMGTGVGGGLVVNGQIINGANGIGGEWGHNHIDDSGGQCYCGKIGCVETVISGPALEKYYHSITTRNLTLQEIAARINQDDACKNTIDRLIHFFGIGISTIINMIDPDVIVIGGGLGNIDLLYTDGIESVKKYVFNPNCQTKILKPKLGDSAGVFGAAYL